MLFPVVIAIDVVIDALVGVPVRSPQLRSATARASRLRTAGLCCCCLLLLLLLFLFFVVSVVFTATAVVDC